MSAVLIEKVLANSVQCGDCLLWQGAMAAGTAPQVRIDGVCVSIRRAMWEALGKKLSAAAVVAKCKEKRCVAPEHLVQKRRGPVVGSKKTLVARVNMANARRGRSILKPEDVDAIKDSDEIPRVLGERYGLSRSQIRNIKSGKCWVDFNNPFSQLIEARP